ncbi:MAG: serine hydrolase domain-containing protein [Candidatus Binatus sp.]|uniref:serine hydrolase domain-containing protein n=1 Tax=Candidatus Binatus sp. TaxID=2811406 RepID=UPI00271FA7B2|nr:serine hydrolase domain-containing protein [Candidatus Binatus sp.]MDO8434360.1 serine hydrolase domain-containing protein [Candidatus Binatus sp.]
MAVKIEGTCDPKFNRVKDAFAENFELRNELGAGAAVTLDGKTVVDLWGGHSDKAKTQPWNRDTLVNLYSTTKGITAICAHRLVDKGLLDLDAPVTRYWPEFGQAGKEKMPVRYLLSHRAGLPAVAKTLDDDAIYHWNTMAAALAAQEPWWEPGTKHGYHALTFGWLVGEVIHRITGKTPGVYLRDEIAGPLKLDLHIGLDAKNDARVSDLIPSPPPAPGEPNLFADIAKNPDSVAAKAFMNPPVLSKPGVANSRAWRGAEIPAANGHGTALSLARIYGALARGGDLDGVHVMSKNAVAGCSIEQSIGADAVLTLSTRFSLGFMMSQPGASLGPNPKSFGHPGAGGSLGFADPEAKIGFGYAMNRMQASLLIDPRATALIDAIYASL